jgi:tetratricopeptide (TPR) repeat protein
MKLKDIFGEGLQAKIFTVTDDDNDNPLKWIIKPTDFVVVPDEEGHFIVSAKQVYANGTIDCFVDLIMPERTSEIVIKLNKGKVVVEDIYEQESTVIPSVACDGFGDYELYYAKENPQVGIDVLKEGLTKSKEKTAIAEDLGYILRDEERFEEAIEAFKISDQTTPSSEFIYQELSQLYGHVGQKEKEVEYQNKFEAGLQ